MPTYEYLCTKCKKRFDRTQKMSEAPLKKCVFCGGKVERQIGAGAGLIFKGTGFYATDYKKKAENTRPSQSGGQAPDGQAASKAEGKEKNENKGDKKTDAPKAKE